jgi:hypothetical protein
MEAYAAAMPQRTDVGMLGYEPPLSKMQLRELRDTAQIIENPISVLKHVAGGTLTPKHMATFNAVYGRVQPLIAEKMIAKIIDNKSKGKYLPYKQRLSASLFLGMPMDATMEPGAIAMNQSRMAGMTQEQQQANQPRQGRALNSLSKLPGIYMTTDSAKEAKRALK